MKTFRIIIVVVFMVACVASNTFASTMASVPGKLEVQRLRWKGRSMRIAVSSSLTQPSVNVKTDSDVMNAIRRSLRAWQSVADIELQLESSDKQSVSPSGAFGDGVSLITIAQTPENVLLFSKDPQAESAKTRVFYNRKGFITEADIVLNPFQQFSTDGTFGTFDLESTLIHEIGHLLGLRHSGVLSATMSERMSRNGVFGLADFSPRTLAESDISAIRELYGAYSDDDTCCASITGKLTLASGRPARNIRVWAEETATGIVMAQVDTGSDGSFRIGGVPAGTYSLFWQTKDDLSGPSFGELGSVTADNGETRVLNEKIVLHPSELALNYVGINNQLADSSVRVSAGREYVIYLGGKNLDPNEIHLDLNSRFFRILPKTIAQPDFGDGISVLSFVLIVDEDTPAGDYSIVASDAVGLRVSLIGALNVE